MGGYSRIGVFVLIVAGIVAYLKTGSTLFEKVKISGLRLQLKSIDRSLQAYEMKSRRYPKNFVAFMRKEFDSKNGKDSALDPWGHQFNYVTQGKNFTIASAGLDGKFGTEDDVSWVREGDKAGLVQGTSKFKGVASASVKSQSKKTVATAETPILKDFETLFSPNNLGKGLKEPMSDEELKAYIEKYLEQMFFE